MTAWLSAHRGDLLLAALNVAGVAAICAVLAGWGQT